MIETWKGEYQGFIKKTGNSGKPYFSHKVRKLDGTTESFTSFGVFDALQNAIGLQVTIPIIRSEEGYCNLDNSRQIEVEPQTIKEAKALVDHSLITFASNKEEDLRNCLRIANSLIGEAVPADGMTAYEHADLVIRLAITMWIQKR